MRTRSPAPAYGACGALPRWNGAVLKHQETITPRSTATVTDGPPLSGTTYTYELETDDANWTATPVTDTVTTSCP